MLENFKCGRCSWIDRSCRPPSDKEELLMERQSRASTLIDSDVMDAVGMDDSESSVGR
jgi:hypothetical protein